MRERLSIREYERQAASESETSSESENISEGERQANEFVCEIVSERDRSVSED